MKDIRPIRSNLLNQTCVRWEPTEGSLCTKWTCEPAGPVGYICTKLWGKDPRLEFPPGPPLLLAAAGNGAGARV